MRTSRFLNFITLLLFAAAIALSGCKGEKKEERAMSPEDKAEVGEQAPPLILKTFQGKEVSLEGLRGKPVVLNFWASWCGPCRFEAPGLEKMHRQYGGKVEFIGVAVSDNTESARKFVDKYGWTFNVGADESGQIGRAYRIFAVPKTYIVGRDGRFVHVITGAVSEEELEAGIKKAL